MSDPLSTHIASIAGEYEPVTDPEQGADQLLEGPLEPGPEIPPEIQDDQSELFNQLQQSEPTQDVGGPTPVEGGEPSSDPEAEPDWKTRFEEMRVESGGRLNQIAELRTRMKEQSDNIQGLRDMFMKQEERNVERDAQLDEEDRLNREAEIYGEEVVNDPAAAYVRDMVAENREAFENYQQQQEHYRRQIAEQTVQYQQQQAANQQVMHTLATQEQAFAKEHPDYDAAYKYARGKRSDQYVRRGYNAQQAEQLVSQEEQGLLYEQMQVGGNVAQAIYDFAKDLGWTGQQAQQQQNPGPASTQRPQMPDVAKMQAGIQNTGLSQSGRGGTPRNPKQLDAETFYGTVPSHKRLEIFANYPEKFEELGRTGHITMPD